MKTAPRAMGEAVPDAVLERRKQRSARSRLLKTASRWFLRTNCPSCTRIFSRMPTTRMWTRLVRRGGSTTGAGEAWREVPC